MVLSAIEVSFFTKGSPFSNKISACRHGFVAMPPKTYRRPPTGSPPAKRLRPKYTSAGLKYDNEE